LDKALKIEKKNPHIPNNLLFHEEVLHEDLVPLSLGEHVVQCEVLPHTCFSVDDVNRVSLGLLEHVVACEVLPLTCINVDDVDLVSLGLLEHVVECEDISHTYISMDMVE